MTDLSPQAQAVLTAQAKERCLFEWSAVNDPPCHPSDADWNGCIQCIDRRGLAAALRAAADQLFKTDILPPGYAYSAPAEAWHYEFRLDAYRKLRTIAAELEGKGND